MVRTQPQLSFETEYRRALSHRNDPQTSYRAADKAVNTGIVNSSVQAVQDYINRFCNVFQRPDFTPKEVAWFISEEDKVDYFKVYIAIQKRKSILKDKDFIVETDRERDGCKVWEKKAK